MTLQKAEGSVMRRPSDGRDPARWVALRKILLYHSGEKEREPSTDADSFWGKREIAFRKISTRLSSGYSIVPAHGGFRKSWSDWREFENGRL
jgi:hypothetical protein